MKYDVCFVTYNSERWLARCIESFSKVRFDTKKISLYFTDNNSTDNSIAKLEELKERYKTVFGEFIIKKLDTNFGFGAGSNVSANIGSGDIVFFCNVDVEIHEEAFIQVEKAILENGDFDAFELRQFPYEHPKLYNPFTMEVTFASGACFLLKRELFIKTKGFDETIFMYGEDVDLSYRIRLLGSKIMYVPSSIIYHYSYSTVNEVKTNQVVGGLVGNYILRAKYKDIKEFKGIKRNALKYFKENKDVENKFMEHFVNAKKNYKLYRKFYKKNVKNVDIKLPIIGLDYSFARSGSFYENSEFKNENTPLISIIIRTYSRPQILDICLNTLKYQTYKKFEVIVCEDGDNPSAQTVVKKYEDELDIIYCAMNSNSGRCLTANKGIELANGEYINFLDDDDAFFPEHLEVVVSNIIKEKGCKMFVTGAVSVALDSDVESSYKFNPVRINNIMPKTIDLKSMVENNQMPIQAVTFHHSLAKDYGVFDNKFIDGLEDWELWVRYVANTKCHVIQKVTSLFRIPLDMEIDYKRMITLQENVAHLRDIFSDYTITVNATDIFDRLYNNELSSERIEYAKELLRVREVYNNIVQSTSWKAINVLKSCFSWIWILFDIVSRYVHVFVDFIFGPKNFKNNYIDLLTPTQLNDFNVLTQKSLCWKVVLKLHLINNKNKYIESKKIDDIK